MEPWVLVIERQLRHLRINRASGTIVLGLPHEPIDVEPREVRIRWVVAQRPGIGNAEGVLPELEIRLAEEDLSEDVVRVETVVRMGAIIDCGLRIRPGVFR